MSEKDLFFLRPFSWLRQIKERELKGCLFDIFMIRVMIKAMTMAVCNKG